MPDIIEILRTQTELMLVCFRGASSPVAWTDQSRGSIKTCHGGSYEAELSTVLYIRPSKADMKNLEKILINSTKIYVNPSQFT